jgi:hypothetical protein
METNANADPEIRREKVLVPQDMCLKEMTEKYGISKSCAFNAKRRGWFIRNYGRNQIIIDRAHFHPASAYGIARQVFWKKFKWNPIAISIKDDMIQEAVSLMFMQSGKIKAGATEKYNDRYGFWWCAYNAMLAYLNTWIRQTRYDAELKDEYHPMMYDGNRRWSSEGWNYC